MERARVTWTDERLDDLSSKVDEGFRRVDADLREMRAELSGVRSDVSARLDALHRLLIQLTGGIIAAVLGTFVASLIVG